jgi:hypothetical protein
MRQHISTQGDQGRREQARSGRHAPACDQSPTLDSSTTPEVFAMIKPGRR